MKNTYALLAFVLASLLVGKAKGQDFIYSLGSQLNDEFAYRIIPTPDSNYLIVGSVTREILVSDYAVIDRQALTVKIDGSGNVLWAKIYGGNNWEEFTDVVYSAGYYYCLGYTRTWVNSTYFTFGSLQNLIADVFLVKLNLDGSLVWAKHMGTHDTGSDASFGNETGASIIRAFQNGVVLVARLNNGASTKQGNAIVWVTPDAKVQWAYQYNDPGNVNSNELVYKIWKDGSQNYITGGTIDNFSSLVGGFTFKVDQDGDLQWAQNTRCSPGIFESQLTGYYNPGNGRIYTTDYYNQSSTSIREPEVITNLASTGAVPASGAIPQAVRFHYGSAGSAGNNYRAEIFPLGDGFQEFVLAANEQVLPDSNTTQYVTLIGAGTDLSYQWAKQVGVPNALNRIHSMVTCIDEDRNLIAVGVTSKEESWGVDKTILVTRISATSATGECDLADTLNRSTLSASNTAVSLERISLNLLGCASDTTCWADSTTIPDVEVSDYGFEGSHFVCGGDAGIGEALAPPSYSKVSECPDKNCVTNLAFSFSKSPKQVYFEITDVTGTYLYERFWGNTNKLAAGYKFDALGYKPGEYAWEMLAIYDNEKGVERRIGRFKIP